MAVADKDAGRRFSGILDGLGLDRADFARLSGLSRSAVDSYCQGWRVPPPIVESWLALYRGYLKHKNGRR